MRATSVSGMRPWARSAISSLGISTSSTKCRARPCRSSCAGVRSRPAVADVVVVVLIVLQWVGRTGGRWRWAARDHVQARAVARRPDTAVARQAEQQRVVVAHHVERDAAGVDDGRVAGGRGLLDEVDHLGDVGQPVALVAAQHELLDPVAFTRDGARLGSPARPQGGQRRRQLAFRFGRDRKPRLLRPSTPHAADAIMRLTTKSGFETSRSQVNSDDRGRRDWPRWSGAGRRGSGEDASEGERAVMDNVVTQDESPGQAPAAAAGRGLSPALEPRLYLDPDVLELEHRAIFERTWQLAGHTADLPAVGQLPHRPGRHTADPRGARRVRRRARLPQRLPAPRLPPARPVPASARRRSAAATTAGPTVSTAS